MQTTVVIKMEGPSERRLSTRIKKNSLKKIESDKSEEAFVDYQSALEKGEILVYSKDQATGSQVSETFDKCDTGNEKQKKKNQLKKTGSPKHASTCPSCKEITKGNKNCDYCSSCTRKFHLNCLETLGDQRCCIECMSRAKWDEEEEADSPSSPQTLIR